jgi:hypothetical protein
MRLGKLVGRIVPCTLHCPRSIKWILPRIYPWHHVRDVAYQALLSRFLRATLKAGRSREGLGTRLCTTYNVASLIPRLEYMYLQCPPPIPEQLWCYTEGTYIYMYNNMYIRLPVSNGSRIFFLFFWGGGGWGVGGIFSCTNICTAYDLNMCSRP